jgi:hypothetical protein
MRRLYRAKHINNIVYLQTICQCDVINLNITSHYYTQKSTIICMHHVCCLVIDIIMCKDQKGKQLQIIDNGV